MQVFKKYFFIIKRNAIYVFLINIIVFLAITAFFVKSDSNSNTQNVFKANEFNVAVINHDDSVTANALSNFITSNNKAVPLEDKDTAIKDALFFRYADAVIIIPEGFEESLFEDGAKVIDMQCIPGSTSQIYIKSMVNGYINKVKIYHDSDNSIPTDDIIVKVEKDLSLNSSIKLLGTSSEDPNELSGLNRYFNFLPYGILSVILMGTATIMLTFNEKDLRRRTFCSPITASSCNFQLFLGNCILAIATWFFFILLSFIMFRGSLATTKGLFYMLNSFIFTIQALGLSIIIGNVCTRKALAPIVNILVLGGCFIGGAFVPQSLLSSTVNSIAAATPIFWYVKSNNIIDSLTVFNQNTLKPVFTNSIILIAFAAAFISVNLLITKKKRLAE